MADLKRKGDLAELAVAADLVRQGLRVLFPFGEDAPYDLVVDRDGVFERVQVKYTTARDGVLELRCRTQSLTGGRVRQVTRYTSEHIDWLAAYDPDDGGCYYVPAGELGTGMAVLALRLVTPRNGQRMGIRMAADYRTLGGPMEPAGLEPATIRRQTRRSPS